jgi:predicted enzyme related to lactoylglutathione lyase
MSNALNWFEIPVTDLARAKSFYGSVLQAELRQEAMNGIDMAILPYREGGVGGALVKGEPFTPGANGAVVYERVRAKGQAKGSGGDPPGRS